jgi:AcrR family transcriptional regulator
MKVCNEVIKARIIQTTSDLLKRNGLKGWNMDLLAQETGLAKNTLYKIIGSKEQLLEQVVISKMVRDLEHIDLIMKEEKDYMTAVNKMIEKFVDLTKNNNFISKIYFEYPSMEMKIKGAQREITASIFRFIRNGMDMGLVRDDLAPEFIFDLIEGAAMHYFRMGLTGSEFEKAFQCAMDCLVNGLKKREQ